MKSSTTFLIIILGILLIGVFCIIELIKMFMEIEIITPIIMSAVVIVGIFAFFYILFLICKFFINLKNFIKAKGIKRNQNMKMIEYYRIRSQIGNPGNRIREINNIKIISAKKIIALIINETIVDFVWHRTGYPAPFKESYNKQLGILCISTSVLVWQGQAQENHYIWEIKEDKIERFSSFSNTNYGGAGKIRFENNQIFLRNVEKSSEGDPACQGFTSELFDLKLNFKDFKFEEITS